MDFWRQNDIVSQERLNRFAYTLIGAGGIGSVVGQLLAKTGVENLTVYDPDIVEDHNLPNQYYRLEDEGRPKVEALADICRAFSGAEITAHQSEFPLGLSPSGIIICGVDSMSARQAIWTQAIKYRPTVQLYIEARMGALEGRIYAVTPCDPDHVSVYEASLYGDDEAVQLPCTARATEFNAFYLAGLLVSQVKKFVMSEEVNPELIFDLTSDTLVAPC